MLYLSLFPSHKDAQQLDPRRPILSSQSSKPQAAKDDSGRRRVGAPIVIKKRVSFSSATQTSSSSSSSKLGVRLAEQDVLLPFVERAAEVEELLDSSSGATLRTSLQAAHGHRATASGENEWHALLHLLTRVDRNELKDRQWLQRIHALVFGNAPKLWCQLAECLGAREVTLYPEQQQQRQQQQQQQQESEGERDERPTEFLFSPTSERFSPLSSPATQNPASLSQSVQWQQFGVPEWPTTTFETLVEVPLAFARPSSLIDCISSRADEEKATERDGGMHSPSFDLTACGADEAATLLADHRHAFAGLRIGLASGDETLTRSSSLSSKSVSNVPEQTRRSRAKSEGGGLLFSRQRRLSELHTLPRMRAMTQDSAATREQAVDTTLRRSSLTSKKRPSGSQGGLGGLGLYRPRATEGDRSGLSSPWDRIGRQRSVTSPPSSSSLSPPSLAVERLTPMTQAESDSQSLPTTLSTQSPPSLATLSASEPAEAKHLAGLLPDGRTLHPSAEPRSPPVPTSPMTSIIFPVPPNSRFSRVQMLLSDLDADQERQGEAWHLLCEAIGVRGVEHVRRTVERAGERSKTSDEVLLRRLAGACFGMVDMDVAAKHDGGGGGGGAQGREKGQVGGKPWFAHHTVRRSRSRSDAEHERFGEMAPMQDLDGEQEDGSDDNDDAVSHEARLQAYYDDVDGYEERWKAFRALLSQVWLVDESVVRKVQNRCGPVARLDMQHRLSSPQKHSHAQAALTQ